MAMNTRKLTLLFTALVGLATSAFAQSTATEATVARVTGTVTATLADGSTVAVTEGSKLPQGATITTGDKSQVFLVSHGDSTSVISENSVVEIAELSTTSAGGKVTEQKATLDLKSGNLVAKLNPAKKSVNQYSVRTPKGVAAARGTVFTVSYKGGTYSIAVVNGTVTILPTSGAGAGVAGTTTREGAAGGDTVGVKVDAGQAYLSQAFGAAGTNGQNVTNFADASQNAAAVDIRELLAVAVATVTLAAQNNIGGTTAAEAAAVAQAVFTAVPAAAEQAGALIKASNDADNANREAKGTPKTPEQVKAAEDALKAVTDATPAAARDALTSGVTTGTFTPNTNTTATNPGANNSQGANQATTPQAIDPNTISRSNE